MTSFPWLDDGWAEGLEPSSHANDIRGSCIDSAFDVCAPLLNERVPLDSTLCA